MMDILILLQFVTIAITLFSLVFGYIVAAKEKTKDNKTEIFSKKLYDNILILRENMNVIMAISNPSSIREQLHFKAHEKPWKDYVVLDKFEEALSNIKAIFFPFYPQENHLLATLESLKQTVLEYAKCKKKKDAEQILVVLKGKLRESYMQYALYDKAMTDAIMEQTANSNYGFYSFDEFYEKFSNEKEMKSLNAKAKLFTRERQIKTVDPKEVDKIMSETKEMKGKKIVSIGE